MPWAHAGTHPTGSDDQVLVIPHTGGRAKFGQVDLSLSAAVKNQLGVANGGTGVGTLSTYELLAGGTTATGALQQVSNGSSGYVLTSNGSSSLPSFQQNSAAPSGMVIMGAWTSCPTGYLAADGSAVSRTTYSGLFSAIGTTYGSGDGSTTFNLPNTQGVFIRGAGSQTISSVTYSGTQGTSQTDQIQNITGTFPGTVSIGGGYTGAFYNSSSYSGNGQNSQGNWESGFDASRVVRAGTETRPANITLLYCIKE